jgi:hypothetical protein
MFAAASTMYRYFERFILVQETFVRALTTIHVRQMILEEIT